MAAAILGSIMTCSGVCRYLCKFGLVTAEKKATYTILCINIIVILYKSVPRMGQPCHPTSPVALVPELSGRLTLCRVIWDDQ